MVEYHFHVEQHSNTGSTAENLDWSLGQKTGAPGADAKYDASDYSKRNTTSAARSTTCTELPSIRSTVENWLLAVSVPHFAYGMVQLCWLQKEWALLDFRVSVDDGCRAS